MQAFRVFIQGEDGAPFAAVWRGEGGLEACFQAFGPFARILRAEPL